MNELEQARSRIQEIDRSMAELFSQRMACSEAIAAYKQENGLPIRDKAREKTLMEKNCQALEHSDLAPYYLSFLRHTIDLSCRYQAELLGRMPEGCHIERGSLGRSASLLGLHGKVFLVTDTGVPASYAEAVAVQCPVVHVERIPAGEDSKSPKMLESLWKAMMDFGLDRRDSVVAVGGGVVGDLAGFAASCYMRGVDFFNVPTTLLSQLDSSIGGKTAVNFSGVKNTIGSFYEPKGVLIDPNVLRTLSPRLIREGLAEAIKMAAISDKELFRLLRDEPLSDSLLDAVIDRSLRIKSAVVGKDPREAGLRRVLNFGHTIGHALEGYYKGRFLHGECVAMGMLPMCAPGPRTELQEVLEKWGLPTGCDASGESLLPYLQHDKKKTDGAITAVLVEEIGSCTLRDMTARELCERWEAIS